MPATRRPTSARALPTPFGHDAADHAPDAPVINRDTLPNGHAPSALQVAIFDEVASAKSSVIVDAVAGSGKSTTIEYVFRACPRGERVLAMAFNKSIATELQRRAPAGVEAATFHSVCWRAYTRGMGGARVDRDKVFNLVKAVVPWDDRAESSMVGALVAKAKTHGLVPARVIAEKLTRSPVKGLIEDTDDAWRAIAQRYDIDLPFNDGRVLGYARDVLTRSLMMTAVVDFDDQLYMTVVYGLEMPKYDRIFVDETQDLSDIQMELVARMGHEGTKYVYVGDPGQAIYAFRGADVHAMSRLGERFGCKAMPLSITYRCAASIVREAQKHKPEIQARENAPEGVVAVRGKATEAPYEPDDLVVCRTNAPLLKLAYALMGKGTKVRVQGRDLGAGLKSLIKRLKARDVTDLLVRLNEWEAKQVAMFTDANESPAKIEAVSDRAEALRAVIEESGAETIPAVEAAVASLFEGDGPAVLLSSIHRAKGLEADRVWSINHGQTPGWLKKRLKEVAESGRAMPQSLVDAMKQESNMVYVATTRAKNELYFVTMDAPKSKRRAPVASTDGE